MSESPRGEARRLAEEMIEWGAPAAGYDTNLSGDPEPTPVTKKIRDERGRVIGISTDITRRTPERHLSGRPAKPPRGK